MKWFLIILSGVLAGLSFPTMVAGFKFPYLGWLAFFAWVPLYLVLQNRKPLFCLKAGVLAHFSCFAVSLFWLCVALYSYGEIPLALSIVLTFLVQIILAFYLALILFLSRKISNWTGLQESVIRPLVWVAIEFLRNYFPFGGFPWNQLGYSQGEFLSFIQCADLFGIYGITLLLLFCNEGVFHLVLLFRKRQSTLCSLSFVLFALILVVLSCFYGNRRLQELVGVQPTSQISVGVLQPNIPQDVKWDEEKSDEVVETLLQLSHGLEQKNVQLILWPEAASPYILAYDAMKVPFDLSLQKTDLLMGAVTLSLEDYLQDRKDKNFNSAMLLDPNGYIDDVYHKNHLVPFGEYLPLKNILFFADKIISMEGELVEGKGYRPLDYRSWKLGMLICFEDLFPEASRNTVLSGAHVLINTTNDAWYRFSSAPWQHLVFSKFRAIETRRDVLRATNTGVTAHIDFTGKVLWQGALFTTDLFTTNLNLREGHSFYVRWGDVLPIFCSIFTLVLFGVGYVMQRKKNKM